MCAHGSILTEPSPFAFRGSGTATGYGKVIVSVSEPVAVRVPKCEHTYTPTHGSFEVERLCTTPSHTPSAHQCFTPSVHCVCESLTLSETLSGRACRRPAANSARHTREMARARRLCVRSAHARPRLAASSTPPSRTRTREHRALTRSPERHGTHAESPTSAPCVVVRANGALRVASAGEREGARRGLRLPGRSRTHTSHARLPALVAGARASTRCAPSMRPSASRVPGWLVTRPRVASSGG